MMYEYHAGIVVAVVILLVFIVLIFVLVGYGGYVRNKRGAVQEKPSPPHNQHTVEPLVAIMAKTR